MIKGYVQVQGMTGSACSETAAAGREWQGEGLVVYRSGSGRMTWVPPVASERRIQTTALVSWLEEEEDGGLEMMRMTP